MRNSGLALTLSMTNLGTSIDLSLILLAGDNCDRIWLWGNGPSPHEAVRGLHPQGQPQLTWTQQQATWVAAVLALLGADFSVNERCKRQVKAASWWCCFTWLWSTTCVKSWSILGDLRVTGSQNISHNLCAGGSAVQVASSTACPTSDSQWKQDTVLSLTLFAQSNQA